MGGNNKVHSVSVLDAAKRFKKDPQDDFHVVKSLHAVLSSADIIVAHNNDGFDKKYLDTRILYHGLPALPPVVSIDTLKVAKSRFLFNSNKLDYLGGYLKVGRKIKTSPGLWMRVMNGDVAAIKSMIRYNQEDVRLLERVYNKLKPYIPNAVNFELFGSDGCPRCGATSGIQSRGVHRAISRVYQRFQCQTCGGWFRSVLNDKDTKVKSRVL